MAVVNRHSKKNEDGSSRLFRWVRRKNDYRKAALQASRLDPSVWCIQHNARGFRVWSDVDIDGSKGSRHVSNTNGQSLPPGKTGRRVRLTLVDPRGVGDKLLSSGLASFVEARPCQQRWGWVPCTIDQTRRHGGHTQPEPGGARFLLASSARHQCGAEAPLVRSTMWRKDLRMNTSTAANSSGMTCQRKHHLQW